MRHSYKVCDTAAVWPRNRNRNGGSLVPESLLSGRQWPAPGEIPITVEIVESILGVLYLAARKLR